MALLVLTALSLLVIDLPATRPLRPVRNVVSSIFRPVGAVGSAVLSPFGDAWRGMFEIDDLEGDRDRLQARLDEIEGQDAELGRLREENALLRELQGVDTAEAETRLTEVVSTSASNFDQTVEIDLGSSDGVEEGMAVLSGVTEGPGGGLFGRVVGVRSNSATVALVSTASFRVGAYIVSAAPPGPAAPTDDEDEAEGDAEDATSTTAATSTTLAAPEPETVQTRGVIAGRGPAEHLVMEGLDREAPVAEGDWVYTLGGDSRFPNGAVIGRVSSVSRGDLSASVRVEPLADLAGRYVKVVFKDAPP